MPKDRLGSSKRDFAEIQEHAFFEDIDWGELYRKEIDPPYKPGVKGGLEDTSCFDIEFLREKAVDSHVAAPVIKEDGFKGFTFAPTKVLS